ncbi:MAG: shikimate dehydrogenase [Candidatus Altiarchaeota archaeon]
MRKRMLGVIGHPIRHSLSPLMHNTVFKNLKLNYTYNAFDVKEGELDNRMEDFRKNFVGINVTIPHKVNVIRHLNQLSEEARLIGAVNTVKFGEETVGYNTDGMGCVRAFEEAGIRIRNKKMLILGAGGAARALAFQLTKEKAEIWISDKIKERAFELAKDVEEKLGRKTHTIVLEDKPLRDAIDKVDIVINATPVGMHPNVNESPIEPEWLRREITVMDIIYNPAETKLLKWAKKIGCNTIDGVGMFVNQGAESLRIWLGIEPPLEVMRSIVLEALKKKA